LSALLVIGCAPAEPATTTESTPATSSAEPKPESTATAEMEKCEKCGMEVAKGELVSEDGKMVCDHCKKM
jgi:CRISPR/Cas system-associated protein Cas10 (large subunit of type III CRISPR-Cas system)